MFLRYLPIFFFTLLLSFCTTIKNTTNSGNNKTTKETKDSTKTSTKDEDEYFDEEYLTLNTTIHWDNIKTLIAYKKGWEISDPAMQLKGSDTLIFGFDELTSDLGSYYYTLIHCNSDWKKSDLLESEYIDGFFQDFISNFKYSFNTLKNYIHYEIQIPNKNVSPSKSGNYILKVYNNNNPDDVILTKRFIVYENVIKTEPKVIRPTILDDREYKQEIDFNLDLGNLVINDLYNDIKVTLLQNDNWNTAITNLTPLFVRGSYLIYDYNKENVFDGGNEYRFLNLKTLRYRGQKIKGIIVENKQTEVYLHPEFKRTYKNYMNYQDLNGRYLVKIQEGRDSHLESDYANVHFSLKYDHKITNGDVYIFGGISNYRFLDEYKLNYNETTKTYEKSNLIKQGYYDYHYVINRKNGKIDVPAMEGNHFETVNNYTLITYNRDQKSDYDRIIGYHNFLSNQ